MSSGPPSLLGNSIKLLEDPENSCEPPGAPSGPGPKVTPIACPSATLFLISLAPKVELRGNRATGSGT